MEDAEESHVLLPQPMPGRGNTKANQSAVRLSEVMCAILSRRSIYLFIWFGLCKSTGIYVHPVGSSFEFKTSESGVWSV